MRNGFIRHLLTILTLFLCALHGNAEAYAPMDTVYFFQSWDEIIYFQPSVMLVNPYIEAFSPFEVSIYSGDEQVNQKIAETGFIAASMGDSVWFVNSEYIQENFRGDVRSFSGLVPLFFNEKVAFITYPGKVTVKQILFGDDAEDAYTIDYYHIDFQNNKVKRVTHSYLSELLEDYHDLQMRYEGMKDFKKREIIEDYYFKYIERARGDVMHPYILDLVSTSSPID